MFCVSGVRVRDGLRFGYVRRMSIDHSDPIMALEMQIMRLKAERTKLRRAQQPTPVENYTLRRPDGSPVTLVELFGQRDELLLVHNMGKSCSYCTLWADGLNGLTDHLVDRAAFVLTSPDEPAELREFARGRGWRFPVASIAGTRLAHDLGFYMEESVEGEPPGYWPGVSALRKDGNAIERTGWSFFGPGDDFCAMWPLSELLPPSDWQPKYDYAATTETNAADGPGGCCSC